MDDCTCYIEPNYDWTAIEFCKEEKKAETSLTCIECNEFILPGEEYIEIWMLDEYEEEHTYSVCRPCEELADAFSPEFRCVGSLFQDLEDMIDDCYPDFPYQQISKLSKPARRRIFKIIDECIERWEEEFDE